MKKILLVATILFAFCFSSKAQQVKIDTSLSALYCEFDTITFTRNLPAANRLYIGLVSDNMYSQVTVKWEVRSSLVADVYALLIAKGIHTLTPQLYSEWEDNGYSNEWIFNYIATNPEDNLNLNLK
jgi:hypothetical protein